MFPSCLLVFEAVASAGLQFTDQYLERLYEGYGGIWETEQTGFDEPMNARRVEVPGAVLGLRGPRGAGGGGLEDPWPELSGRAPSPGGPAHVPEVEVLLLARRAGDGRSVPVAAHDSATD